MTDQPGAVPASPPAGDAATRRPPARWRTGWFTVVTLVVVFPVGIVLMWTRRPGWGRAANSIVTGAVAIAAALAVFGLTRSTLLPHSPSAPSAVLTSPSGVPSATPATGAPSTSSPTAAPPGTRPPASPPATHAPAPPGLRNVLTWPFASTSIWNMPIGTAAVYVPANIAAVTQRTVVTDQDVIIMQPAAPLTPIAYNGAGWSGASRCAGSGQVLASVPIPSSLIVPNGKGNYGFAILAQDGHTVIQGQPMARCTPGGPATAMHLGPPANLYTDGTLGAHGGSGLSSLGGTIRLGELLPGSPPIRHALKVNLDGAADYWPAGFRWPAVKEDGYGPQRYGGKVPALKMGALLALPASLNLASLNLQTAPGRMIAWTLQNYGAYCVDDAARSVYSIATELGPGGAVIDQFQKAWGYSFVSGLNDTPWARDIAAIFTHLAVVDNNSPSSIGGAGPRLQSYAPAFSAITTVSSQSFFSATPFLAGAVSWLGTSSALTLGIDAWQSPAPVVLVRRELSPTLARSPPT